MENDRQENTDQQPQFSEAVTVNTTEAVGTIMLGIIALVLLVTLLREMERNRQLLVQAGA